jgi:hypothetical protein
VESPFRRSGTMEIPPQPSQGRGFVRVAPQIIEGLVIGAERGSERLDREGADAFRVREPVPGPDRSVGGQGRRARRAAQQRLLFGLIEIIALQPGEDAGHREDFTGSGLAIERHLRHWPVEQGGHPIGDRRPDPGMPRHEARQAGEQDAAHHGRIEEPSAEARAGCGPRGPADGFPARWTHGRPVPCACRHDPARLGADPHGLTTVGNAPEVREREVVPGVHEDRHG